MTKEQFVEKMEWAVLNAMDGASTHDGFQYRGWIDSELPKFLPQIRLHAETVFQRIEMEHYTCFVKKATNA